MRIAIPTIDGALCQHFGHCRQFAVVEVNPETRLISESRMLTPPQHEPGVLPAWLSQMGCDLIIAGGMGGRAIELFRQSGVEVVIGATPGKPEEIVLAYVNGTLDSGANSCDH